jgi:hypothetical protein
VSYFFTHRVNLGIEPKRYNKVIWGMSSRKITLVQYRVGWGKGTQALFEKMVMDINNLEPLQKFGFFCSNMHNAL